MFADLSITKLAVLGGILLLLFGSKKLNQIATDVAKAIASFRAELNNGQAKDALNIADNTESDANKKGS